MPKGRRSRGAQLAVELAETQEILNDLAASREAPAEIAADNTIDLVEAKRILAQRWHR